MDGLGRIEINEKHSSMVLNWLNYAWMDGIGIIRHSSNGPELVELCLDGRYWTNKAQF